jgi:ATP-binding cassette subfamily B protein RaxB
MARIDEQLELGIRSRRRVPVMMQTEAAECGLACIAMIAAHHGHQVDLAGLRAKFSISLKGSTLSDLMTIAASLDFAARPLRVELDQLGALQLPCVLHWDLNHFVVLVSADNRRITFNDPGFGRRTMSIEEASKHFTGVALELTPTPGFTPREAKRDVSLRQLIGKTVGFRGAVAQLLGLALALETFALLAPLLMQWVVDQAIVSGDRSLLGTLAIGFLLLGLIQASVSIFRGWAVIRLGTSLNVQWMSNVFAHMIRLPTAYFEKRHLGDVVSRFGSIESIQRTLTGTFVEAILDGVMAVITFTMMLMYTPRLAAITVCAVLAYGALRVALYRIMRELAEEQIVLGAKQESTLLETIRGIQSIKLFSRENDRQARWMNLMVETTNRSLRTQKLSLLSRFLNSMLFMVENVLIVFLGAQLVLDKSLTLGMLFAFMAYKSTFATRVSTLIDRAVELSMLRLQAERLADIVLTERENTTPNFVAEPVEGASAIEVRDLSFRYADNDPLVLDRISFEIRSGESVAITGPSGCGKTTLVKLMLGLIQPTSGDILVDGVSIFALGPAAYRRRIAAVMQEDQLFAGSIAENIAFFDPQPDTAAIERCARMAAIHDDVLQMPMRYQTLVGDMGTALSGGQKQRLLLARALYKEPKLLFLDEATSHLDVDNERLVGDAVRRLALTRIIVAHRPETIRSADRQIMLERLQGDRAVPAGKGRVGAA